MAELHITVYMRHFHSCKINEPSILLSMNGGGGKFKGESVSLKHEVGAGLNSYGPSFCPQTCNQIENHPCLCFSLLSRFANYKSSPFKIFKLII